MPRRWFHWLGSLVIAVPLLVLLAGVLAWGTIYETRFGTAAVQRFVYTAWWFQGLLGFLALNLAASALERYPWKRSQIPFLLAHLGIILILVGGILGGRLGIEGQLIIPEGETQRTLLAPGNALIVRQPNPGIAHVLPTAFETQAWIEEPGTVFTVPLEGRTVTLTVDRYYPDADVQETITGDGTQENPAAELRLEHEAQQDRVWLLARDPERFGIGWGGAHVVFLEPQSDEALAQLLGQPRTAGPVRGILSLTLPGEARPRQIPVPETLNEPMTLRGTPYEVIFKDYFPDFVLGPEGPNSRSLEPNNPAVAFVLKGPEGTDAYLLFALHPEIGAMHGWAHAIKAEAAYTHPASGLALPPQAIALVRRPAGALVAVLTGPAGERQLVDPVVVGTASTHPWLGYRFTVVRYEPRANLHQEVVKRGDKVRAEALHVVAREGEAVDEGWVGLGGPITLQVGREPVLVEYRRPERTLPFTVKLLDFRKITYPGIEMAAGFESDVELTDARRGLILMRTIKMNHPLKYRGYTLYQSSFIEGPVETTVLSVRNDPGTPLVYAGFLIVIAGVITMFVMNRPEPPARPRRARAK